MTENIVIRGENLELLPERCVFLPSSRTLLAADLHWGKAEVFQRSGIAVSSKVLADDLQRLSRAIERTKPSELIILGDLIHAPVGITPEVVAAVSAWRDKHAGLKISLIRGNHDRRFILPEIWRIEVHDSPIERKPFLLAHDPPTEPGDLHVLSGHLHPVVRLTGGGDSLRLPCFAVGKTGSVLPAFSLFTGGLELKKRDWRQLFVVTDNSVIEV